MGRKHEQDRVISVIIPVYNAKKYLAFCIDSVLRQTYANLDIILVDDGSIDGSSEICDKYAEKDYRIKVIHKENGGVVSARKAGVQAAEGDYIAYVDADDWIEKEMYEILIGRMLQTNADIVTSGLYRNYAGATVEEFDNVPAGEYDCEEISSGIFPILMYEGTFFRSGINVHLFNKLFKRELVEKKQSEVADAIRIGEDAALVYPCMLEAKKIVVMHECFYHYCIRQEPGSMMGSGDHMELFRYKYLYKLLKEKIEQRGVRTSELYFQLNYLMLYLLLLKEPETIIRLDHDTLYPFNIKKGERVVLYGGGRFGNSLQRFLTDTNWCSIVLWVDKSENIEYGVADISKLYEMKNAEYDKVIISVLIESVVDEIYNSLISNGINEEKIVDINFRNMDEGIIENIFQGI